MNWKPAAIFVIVLVLIGGGMYLYSLPDDGIEEGKTYGLAMTYKSTIKGGGEGRVFDFADRNLPRTSILVPVHDAHGIPLVREVENIQPSTVRKVRIKVPRRELEDVVYPAYEYVQWQFRFATKEAQAHVPTVTPRR